MSDEEYEKKIRIEKSRDDIPVEDIKEILGIVNNQLPQLIRGLFSSLYDAESAEQYAKGIGTIYRELNEQGLPQEMIETLVMKYADNLNIIGNAMKNINIDGKRKDDDDD